MHSFEFTKYKSKKAKEILVFESKLGLDDMCKSSFNWQIKNPKGVWKINIA